MTDLSNLSVEDDLHVEEELEIQDESVRPPKALSADQFQHPIDDLCGRETLVTVAPGASVAEVIALMQEHRLGAVLVVDADKLAGIITERDLLMKVLGHGIDPAQHAAREIMTRDPQTLMRGDDIAYLLNAMRVGGFRHVPIVDEHGHPTNVISLRDVLAFIVDNFPAEVINLPFEPFRGTPSQYG